MTPSSFQFFLFFQFQTLSIRNMYVVYIVFIYPQGAALFLTQEVSDRFLSRPMTSCMNSVIVSNQFSLL